MPIIAKTFTFLSAGTNAGNQQVVQNTASRLYGYDIGNNGAADACVHIFDSATAVTTGSGTPVRSIFIPKDGRAEHRFPEGGMAFQSGLTFTITALISATDATAVAANQVAINMEYL